MPKITADKLNAELAKGILAPVYLLTGEDVFRKNEVISRIKQVVNPDDFNYLREQADPAAISQAMAQANTAPVFSNARLIVLTGLDKLRKDAKNPREVLIRYLENPLPTTTLILTHNDTKKMKAEKVLAEVCADHGRVVNFEELKDEALEMWVSGQLAQRGLKTDVDAVRLLCEIVGNELSALSNEIEKLFLYTLDRENKTISSADVLACVGFSKEMGPFDLANALTACQKNTVLKLIDKLVDDGEEPVAILSKMTYPILKMARIKRLADAGFAPKEILHKAGLLPWEIYLASSARRFPAQKNFLQVLNRIIDVDAGFKSGANLDPKTTLKGLILTLFR